MHEPADEVEQALLRAHALIAASVSAHRRRTARPGGAGGPSDGGGVDSAAWVIRRAERSVDILVGGVERQAWSTGSALAELRVLARPGVTVRLLCGPAGARLPAVRGVAGRGGDEVRVSALAQGEAILVDSRIALVRSAREPAGRQVFAVQDPAAVRALALLFGGVWSGARPLSPALSASPSLSAPPTAVASPHRPGPSAHQVLAQLQGGHTDEVAAQRLRISTRTYRRQVAELLRALGATSRFQAGARAVELGLVRPTGSDPADGDPAAGGAAGPRGAAGSLAAAGPTPGRAGPRGAASTGDEVERALLETQALLESTVARYRERPTQEGSFLTLHPDGATLRAAGAELMARARQQTTVLLGADEEQRTDGPAPWCPPLAAGPGGARIRILGPSGRLARARSAEPLRWADPRTLTVRATVAPLALDALVVDGRSALLRTGTADGPRAVLIHCAPVVRTLDALVENLWLRAGPVAQPVDLGDRAGAARARRILRCLDAGLTDEVAARELAVSLRTYRRYVAAVMAALGAGTRFQAGVRATEAGLLAPRVSVAGRAPRSAQRGGSEISTTRGAASAR
ncbi:hypothetical protein GCM10009665_04140 [Kitasatospora nipponensis]|uniref:HTH luxR-type domain-containing protein n=1 Tax=Kitasatospora nipponensis TaxID=258049 RepID=A0ABN1VNC8_9ACTN